MPKYILLIFLLTIFIETSARVVDDNIVYDLSWEGDGVRVETWMETSSLEMFFDYGDENYGGLKEQMKWLQELQVKNGNLVIDSLHHSFSIKPEGGKINLSYVIRCSMDKIMNGKGCIRDMFMPDIDTAMLYIQGFNLFVKPRINSDITATVRWKTVPTYPVFCLYNPGNGTMDFTGSVEQITSSVIIGDPLLSVDSVMIKGHLNFLVTALRKNKEKNKSDLIKFMKQLYGNITTFWDDNMEHPYSLVIFPFRYNTFEVSGNGYSNGFLSRYDATCDTILNRARRDVYTHEIGHKWIGNGPSWFAEGFNEMQTAYHIVNAGLDTPEYFLTYLNVALKGLCNNPHRNEPDSVAETHFWDDSQYIWLLYWRGFSYAFFLSGEIEHQTGTKNSYKQMMMALKNDVKDMTAEKFLSDMKTVISEKILQKSYNEYIVKGKDINFNKVHLPSGCSLYYLPTGEPQIKITDLNMFSEHFK